MKQVFDEDNLTLFIQMPIARADTGGEAKDNAKTAARGEIGEQGRGNHKYNAAQLDCDTQQMSVVRYNSGGFVKSVSVDERLLVFTEFQLSQELEIDSG